MDKKKLFKNQYIIQISKHMVGTIANYTKMLREYIFATKKLMIRGSFMYFTRMTTSIKAKH